ncbi:MAG: hypothetical protein QGG40_14655 [Myxococcota bacterium]|jgi:hypothetical protein|nr:hypothetical protein [Myxococcota bacterium]
MPRSGTLGRTLVILCWFGCQSPTPTPEPAAPPASEVTGTQRADPTTEDHRKQIFGNLRERVDALGEAGTYDCCIKVPCSHCALLAGGCMCGEGLRRGEPVCEECALMWAKGQGDEPGVDPGSVRSFLEAMRDPGSHPGCDCSKGAASPEHGPDPQLPVQE